MEMAWEFGKKNRFCSQIRTMIVLEPSIQLISLRSFYVFITEPPVLLSYT